MNRIPSPLQFKLIAVLCLQMASVFGFVLAEEKPVATPPVIAMTVPSAIDPATTKSLIVRGLHLDQITAIMCTENTSSISFSIVRKEKSAPPEKVEASDGGDTLVELTLSVPSDFVGDSLAISVSSENGVSEQFRIPVISGGMLVAESEPNNSLRKAQPIKLGTTIQGLISQPGDIDVYEFQGTAGQILLAEISADRIGSPCDSQLTLFDSAGQILKIVDDSSESSDAILKVTLPHDDTYRIVMLEATDRGSAICTYLLRITLQPQ